MLFTILYRNALERLEGKELIPFAFLLVSQEFMCFMPFKKITHACDGPEQR